MQDSKLRPPAARPSLTQALPLDASFLTLESLPEPPAGRFPVPEDLRAIIAANSPRKKQVDADFAHERASAHERLYSTYGSTPQPSLANTANFGAPMGSSLPLSGTWNTGGRDAPQVGPWVLCVQMLLSCPPRHCTGPTPAEHGSTMWAKASPAGAASSTHVLVLGRQVAGVPLMGLTWHREVWNWVHGCGLPSGQSCMLRTRSVGRTFKSCRQCAKHMA